jgi:hypothetical protein
MLSEYLDDAAAEELCLEVERHLHDCGPCEVEIDAIKKTILIYKSDAGCKPLSDSARQRLFAVLSYEYRQVRRTDFP